MNGPPHFSLAGFPVRVEPTFFLVVGLLGLQSELAGPMLAAWVGIAFASVLVHELGHAIAYRVFGASAAITLWGLGGLTYGSNQPRRRWQRVVVSLAGPLSTLVLLGLPSVALARSGWASGDVQRELLVTLLVFINVGWSVLNLLPVLPLDGGRVVQDLAGDTAARAVTIVVGVPLIALAIRYEQPFAAVLLGFFIFQALATQRDPRRVRMTVVKPERQPRTQRRAVARAESAVRGLSPARPEEAEAVAWELLAEGRVEAARAAQRLAGDHASAWLTGAIAAAESFHGSAAEQLVRALHTEPPPGPAAETVADVVVRADLHTVLGRTLLRTRAADDLSAAHRLERLLADRGHARAAAQVTEQRASVAESDLGATRFEAACRWATAGETAHSLAQLRKALDQGFADRRALEERPELAPVRALPEWAPVHGSLSG